MKTVDIDKIIKENTVLMQQIKERREKFMKEASGTAQKRK